ncbi:hypothetical protein C8J56DRAFT_898354 [Mycena floridula]|nr:hypothetical protein C8J56DRAFT_898354 [Mycena floridula]
MDSIQFQGPNKFNVVKVPVPSVGEDDILIKCSTNEGYQFRAVEFVAVIAISSQFHPGHETVGVIASLGKSVTGFSEGDRCVVDPMVSSSGGRYHRKLGWRFFTVYCRVHKIFNLTDEEAALVEPASCALHGMDVLNLPAGSDALVLGAGPSGLMFAQLLKYNGAVKVVLAWNKGVKMDTAKKLNMADEYIELDRNDSEGQWAQLKGKYPHGFDAVVEATGAKQVLEIAPIFVRKGGALLLYALYEPETRITGWNSAYLLSNEIRVTHAYSINEFQQAVDVLSNKEALKIIVRPH